MDYTNYFDSPLGKITLGSDGKNLIGLWFNDQKYFADSLETHHQKKELFVFNETKKCQRRQSEELSDIIPFRL